MTDVWNHGPRQTLELSTDCQIGFSQGLIGTMMAPFLWKRLDRRLAQGETPLQTLRNDPRYTDGTPVCFDGEDVFDNLNFRGTTRFWSTLAGGAVGLATLGFGSVQLYESISRGEWIPAVAAAATLATTNTLSYRHEKRTYADPMFGQTP